MRRTLAGLFFVIHGLAHAASGMGAQDAHGGVVRVSLATLLFSLATPGFVVAGLGVWGVPRLERHWRVVAQIAAVASALLLALAWRGILEMSLGLSFQLRSD
jgi:hypothetical protein